MSCNEFVTGSGTDRAVRFTDPSSKVCSVEGNDQKRRVPSGERRSADPRRFAWRSDDSFLFWLFDVLSVLAFVLLEGWGWWGLFDTSTRSTFLLVLPSLVLSWGLSDLASGAVHFAADHCGSKRTPVLGKFLISPFRQHHEQPKEMLSHGFFERNGNCALVGLLAFFWVPFTAATTPLATLLQMTALGVGLWTLGTNQFHAWAHATTRPGWVSFLQKNRIILPPAHHQIHHAPFEHAPAVRYSSKSAPRALATDNYCITHGNCEWALRGLVKLFRSRS